jgi:aminoglycoside 6'-N-acetyltransferase I
MPVEIRRIGAGDAGLLARVADDVFDDDIDPARTAAYLAEKNHMLIVAIEDGVVVGQTAGMVHRHVDQPTELYIDNLGVTPDLRRRGIARRLVEDLIAWGKAQGCEEAWVGTEPDNEAARGLYVAMGGEVVDIVMYEYEL